MSGKILTRKRLRNGLTARAPVGGCLAAIVLALAAATAEAARPVTIAELALYRSTDRDKVLIEGAKREGQLAFYNSLTSLAAAAQEFEKKYPFVKVSIWRSDSTTLIKRVTEEFAAGRFLADVVETSGAAMALLHKAGVFQEYYSPEMVAYADEVKAKAGPVSSIWPIERTTRA